MNQNFLKISEEKNLNIIFIIISFLIIFLYYLNFDFESGKGTLIKIANQDRFTAVNQSYGLWGLLNQKFFAIFDFFIGKYFSINNLWTIIFGLQLSIIWTFLIYKIKKIYNNYFSLILLIPYILSFLSQCTRDAITLALFFLLAYKSWNLLKFSLSILLSFSIHKSILPLVIISALITKIKDKSKGFFLIISFLSIILSFLIFIILRYTDFHLLIPRSFYGEVLRYPRYWFTGGISLFNRLDINMGVYNFEGNLNFKILFFGYLGQLLSIFWKEKLKGNIFSLCFSSFFICTIFSSVPNGNRFIYHPLIITSPFYITFSFFNLKQLLKKFKEDQ